MKPPIKIGDKEFKYKKDALLYFKTILNSYDFGERLNENDTKDVVSLFIYEEIERKDTIGSIIEFVRIGKVQYGVRCFEVVCFSKKSYHFSYIIAINGSRNPFTQFSLACRNAIQEDILNVKQKYFDKYSKKGQVKCQETGLLSFWTELNVDHRQPNTFSIILDRFIELNNIDLHKIEYEKDKTNKTVLKDKELENKFQDYHIDKANLRVVRKENNLGRSHQGRVKKQKKDLRIERNNKG